MRKTQETFISNLRRLMKSLYPKQADFAEAIGMSVRGYQKYEQGESSPTPEVLDKLAIPLKCNPWELLLPEGFLLKNSPGIQELAELIAKQNQEIEALKSKLKEASFDLPEDILAALHSLKPTKYNLLRSLLNLRPISSKKRGAS